MASTLYPEYDWEYIDISTLAVARLDSVGDLLRVLDMSRLETKFESQGIDLPTLFFVQDEHLMQLGLNLPERIKLLRCVQLLKDVPPPPNGFMPVAAPVRPLRPLPTAAAISTEEKSGEEEEQAQDLIEEEDVVQEEEDIVQEEEGIVEEEQLDEMKDATSDEVIIVPVVIDPQQQEEEMVPCHSMVFLRSEASGISEKYCTSLQATFEDDLKAKSVAFVPSDDAVQVLKCLDVFLANSLPTDDLLWVVFTGTIPSPESIELMPGLTFQQLASKIEETYRGRRVFIIVDTCAFPEFAEDATDSTKKANENLQVSLLYSVYPAHDEGALQATNPCYLTLCLLDTIRARIYARMPSKKPYDVTQFAEDAVATVEFLARCSDMEIVTNYVSTFTLQDTLELIQPERLPVPKTLTSAIGLRGIYEDRPVQIIEMNGPQRVQIRFLDEDCDTEWVNFDEVLVDDEGSAVVAGDDDEEEEEEESRDGGRGRPLPIPPSGSSHSLTEEEKDTVEALTEEELVQEVLIEDIVEETLASEEAINLEEVPEEEQVEMQEIMKQEEEELAVEEAEELAVEEAEEIVVDDAQEFETMHVETVEEQQQEELLAMEEDLIVQEEEGDMIQEEIEMMEMEEVEPIKEDE